MGSLRVLVGVMVRRDVAFKIKILSGIILALRDLPCVCRNSSASGLLSTAV